MSGQKNGGVTVATLYYDSACVYCQFIVLCLSLFDPAGLIHLKPLSDPESRKFVKFVHGGRFVHAPHVKFEWSETVAYGVTPVAVRILPLMPFIALASAATAAWRKLAAFSDH